MSKGNCFKVELLRATSKLPKKATRLSTGFDLYADVQETIPVKPFERKLINTGIKIKGKEFVDIQVRPRSGLAIKKGLTVLNTPGTIDPDYTGEVKVIIANLSSDITEISPGERVAQLIIPVKNPILEEGIVEGNEERGDKGFGSTGNK